MGREEKFKIHKETIHKEKILSFYFLPQLKILNFPANFFSIDTDFQAEVTNKYRLKCLQQEILKI